MCGVHRSMLIHCAVCCRLRFLNVISTAVDVVGALCQDTWLYNCLPFITFLLAQLIVVGYYCFFRNVYGVFDLFRLMIFNLLPFTFFSVKFLHNCHVFQVFRMQIPYEEPTLNKLLPKSPCGHLQLLFALLAFSNRRWQFCCYFKQIFCLLALGSKW